MNKYEGFEGLLAYEEGADSKARILNSAIYNFARYGYAKTKTKEIAIMAGVSEALVFKYYLNKQQLLGEVCLTILEERLPALFEYKLHDLFDNHKTLTSQHFTEVLKDKFNYIESNTGYFKILYLEIDDNSQEIIDQIRSKIQGFWTILEGQVSLLQEAGKLRSDIPSRSLVRSISGMLGMLLVDRKFLQTSLELDTELDTIFSIILEGVKGNEDF